MDDHPRALALRPELDGVLTSARLLAAALLVACLAAPEGARAAECPARVVDWVARCAKSQDLDAHGPACFGAVLTLDLSTSDGGLRVEIAPASERSFRKVGALGLSPVGEFADWSREPPSRHDAFERLARCAAADPDLVWSVGPSATPSSSPEHTEGPGESRPRWPLRLALAAALSAFTLRHSFRSTGVRRTALVLLLVAAAAAAVRLFALPTTFLHQNGQGPLWVAAALGQVGRYWPYGDGYRDVFSLAASAASRAPESGVFLLQGILGAVSIACAWLLAERASASRATAWAAAIAVGLDPGLGRLSQSESYYGTTTSLLFVSAALLALAGTWREDATGGPVGRERWSLFIAAGLVLAEAARIHPVCWTAAALLPLVITCQDGPRRRRLELAALSAVTIGAVLLLSSGLELRRVIQGPLGGQWLGVAGERMKFDLWLVAPLGAAGAFLSVQRRQLARATGALILVVSAFFATNFIGDHAPWIDGATWRLFAPVLVAGFAATLRLGLATLPDVWPAGALLALALMAFPDRARVTRLPTDVLEAEWARTWRHQVPQGMPITYLERAGKHVARLPLYRSPRCGSVLTLSANDDSELRTLQGESIYYHSSLCSTPEGREACKRIEASLDLKQMDERILPAIPSMQKFAYDSDTVRVALYRATRRGSP